MTLAAETTRVRSPRPSGAGRGRRPVPWFKYLSVAPLVILLLAFVGYPVYELVKTSLGTVRLEQGQFLWEFSGFDNFSRVFTDDLFLTSLKNSLIFILATVALTLLFGIALALIVDRATGRLQRVAQNILIWPAIVAPVVVSVVWLLILSPQIGLLNRVLDSLGLPEQGWLGQPVGAMASVIAVDVWHWTPIVFLLVYTALRAIDSSLLEAARVDGATYWQTLRSITLPILTPAIIGAAVIRIIMGVKVFDEMYLLTFGGPGTATTVISIYIRSVFFEDFNFGYGAALSVTVVVLVMAVFLVAVGVRRMTRSGGRRD
ncbi:carbohydrate ABC transporter permease [Phytoactinopolyspora halotolerans]|uniref:Sugar ABC transporter permease n=1 Tax=Phytoactinopolyspora halotolerans TaxID=1981512 RepID=A0A6L9S4D2_9ACTN|nr:sugar ABC transporter permease [Phytoactinopolyspora halotolerans]NED99493.1 sugar ABC transporter permease [Phytoactinopolyspora halotolerans]